MRSDEKTLSFVVVVALLGSLAVGVFACCNGVRGKPQRVPEPIIQRVPLPYDRPCMNKRPPPMPL